VLIWSKNLYKISLHICIYVCICIYADPGGRAVLRPLAYWDCGFESRRGCGFLSLVSVVCCACASDRSLVQRSPTDSGVSECDREVSIMQRLQPTRGCCAVGETFYVYAYVRTYRLGDPGVDGRKILRWIFRKWDVRVWIGSSWLRIGTGGGHL